MADLSKLSLNTVTLRDQYSLEQCIEACDRYGIRGISPWRDKLQACGVKKAAKLLQQYDLTVTGHCRAGLFPATTKAERQKIYEENCRAVDEAAAIQAHCLILIAGGMPEGSKDIGDAHDQVREGLARLLEYAKPNGVRLAIEPLHPMYASNRACINSMEHANDICDELNDPLLGIAFDVYHLWWDPHLKREIERAGQAKHQRFFAFHICDWLYTTNDFLLDRGMMGEGVIDIRRLRNWVEAQGYTGFHEVEVLSSRLWKEPGERVIQQLIESYEHCVL